MKESGVLTYFASKLILCSIYLRIYYTTERCVSVKFIWDISCKIWIYFENPNIYYVININVVASLWISCPLIRAVVKILKHNFIHNKQVLNDKKGNKSESSITMTPWQKR